MTVICVFKWKSENTQTWSNFFFSILIRELVELKKKLLEKNGPEFIDLYAIIYCMYYLNSKVLAVLKWLTEKLYIYI